MCNIVIITDRAEIFCRTFIITACTTIIYLYHRSILIFTITLTEMTYIDISYTICTAYWVVFVRTCMFWAFIPGTCTFRAYRLSYAVIFNFFWTTFSDIKEALITVYPSRWVTYGITFNRTRFIPRTTTSSL